MTINVRRPMITMVMPNGTHYTNINYCEVTDRPLAVHCGKIVVAESGPWTKHFIV